MRGSGITNANEIPNIVAFNLRLIDAIGVVHLLISFTIERQIDIKLKSIKLQVI